MVILKLSRVQPSGYLFDLPGGGQWTATKENLAEVLDMVLAHQHPDMSTEASEESNPVFDAIAALGFQKLQQWGQKVSFRGPDKVGGDS